LSNNTSVNIIFGIMQGSPFLTPPANTSESTLALVSLGRAHVPAILSGPSPKEPNGQIINTRFGAYPHSTLLNLPWGTQVLASNVGALNRRRGTKRKQKEAGISNNRDTNSDEEALEFEAAASGFAHVLIPTPESWTVSLPHRTQVVYTPDYSFILQRIFARPGTKIIEAGAGSGSFTHASARAVFNGYPSQYPEKDLQAFGKVFSFEYHEPRYESLTQEIKDHGLSEIVHVTHRDVYEGGFCLDDKTSPNADAIFLDLPAPWLALPYLTRSPNKMGVSPLNADASVHICSFSPCIEQAQKTVATLREMGWVNVTMSALHHSRIDVRRERIGLQEEGLKGGVPFPADVDEALSRLRELENKTSDFIERRKKQMEALKLQGSPSIFPDDEPGVRGGPDSKKARLASLHASIQGRKVFKEGRLVHRTEPELKTHTSYLVFGILPREWTEVLISSDKPRVEPQVTKE
jgi:tRNA (adenine57-N1/adenine58-N1)-methyltransferase